MAKPILILALAITVLAAANGEQQQQQRVLRRVIKSTPTATNLGRVRLVTVRSANAQPGAVAEISSKEAANFGQRAEPSGQQQAAAAALTATNPAGVKTKAAAPASAPTSTTTSTTTTSTTTTTSAPSTTSAPKSVLATSSTQVQQEQRQKASERQQAAPQPNEVEVLAIAPSSWQTMTAVEAPAAALIAAGPRAAASSDLSSSSSEESLSTSDFLRASSSKTNFASQSVGETFSRLRQSGKTSQQQQQQSFFYPQQQRVQGKTSQQQASKTVWYQPTTSTTTPRPAPIVQEQQYEQYVEQQQVEGAAPLGQAEPFAFDFNTQDNNGNGQYRKEESDKNGVVRGSYGYTDANGIYRHVEYVADQDGFRANIKSNEPGLIGETQPASIKLASGPASQRTQVASSSPNAERGEEWTASSNSNSASERADLALAPPDFESSHKSDRLRSPRHFRN